MLCWKCGKEQEDAPSGRLAFRAICEACSAWLHCCCNCQNYKPGLPNDCASPGTEHIADREACNFCEEFQLLGKGPIKKGDPKKAAYRLFGKEEKRSEDRSSKDRFDSLFKD